MPATRTSGGCEAVALWGDEHTALDQVATARLGGATAIALSRGRHPKGYVHTDPNEDAVAAAMGPGGGLLAVADGHDGFLAAREALTAVVTAAADALGDPRTPPTTAVGRLSAAAREAVVAACRHNGASRAAGATALSIALVTPGRLHVATWGDTVVARVRAMRVRALRAGAPFLGSDAAVPATHSIRLRPGDVVLAASDGLTDFLGRQWRRAVVHALGRDDAEPTVRRLVHEAFAGGAGDNVAVAITATPADRSGRAWVV